MSLSSISINIRQDEQRVSVGLAGSCALRPSGREGGHMAPRPCRAAQPTSACPPARQNPYSRDLLLPWSSLLLASAVAVPAGFCRCEVGSLILAGQWRQDPALCTGCACVCVATRWSHLWEGTWKLGYQDSLTQTPNHSPFLHRREEQPFSKLHEDPNARPFGKVSNGSANAKE